MALRNFGNGIARGMAITFSHLFKKPVTTQYPEEKLNVSRRIRGTELGWSPDECSACLLCQDSCPHGCITINTSGARRERLAAPCTSTCPSNVDAARYVHLLSEGKTGEAVAVVRERIPFPVVCAYVCAHPCEGACTRGELDEPIAIRMLKRYAVDNDTGIWKTGVQQSPASGRKVAVIGAGPAGMTGAYYLARKGHQVTIFDSLPQAGGMTRIGIPSYRLPRHLLDRDVQEIKNAGVVFKMNTTVENPQELLSQGFDAVFIGIGAHQSARLNIPGEDDPRVLGGVEFLKPVNMGKQVTLGKRVIIVGGGNTAMDAARTAVRLGAKEVSILYRRSRNEMPAAIEEVEDTEAEGVKLILLSAPVKIDPAEDCLQLECVKMQLGAPDETGRRRPEPVEGSQFVMRVDNIIAAIGQKPVVGKHFSIETAKGNVLVNENMMTSINMMFAAGDCATGPKTIIEAIAGARKAAIAIDKALGGDGDISEKLAPEDNWQQQVKDTILWKNRPEFPMIAIEKRKTTFEGAELGWDKATAEDEASRCLKCGQYNVASYQLDGGRCIYCGLCVESCHFNALFMGRGYERSSYLLDETVLKEKDMRLNDAVTPSAYNHPELEEGLPEQTLLINGERKG
ncbi:MAG: FAD-dependent oxidoreductase [Dehalococcoidales bacterium]|nr:FAD-dependent oxidoreductase [Dehalococcoidales bacterium]